jgi:hypothetical protein
MGKGLWKSYGSSMELLWNTYGYQREHIRSKSLPQREAEAGGEPAAGSRPGHGRAPTGPGQPDRGGRIRREAGAQVVSRWAAR